MQAITQAAALLQKQVSTNDMNELLNYVIELNRLLPFISQSKVDALVVRRQKESEIIVEIPDTLLRRLNATSLNKYIDGKIPQEVEAHEKLVSLEKNIATILDALRSVISYEKTRMDKEYNAM